MKYHVLLRFRRPAWDEKDGIPYGEVEADSKAEAIKAVRRKAYDDGHTVGLSASDYSFTAKEAE